MKLEQATKIAAEIVDLLRPACERIEIGGSIRRGKEDPKDIEIVFIPRLVAVAVSLFDIEDKPATDDAIAMLVEQGVIQRDTEVKRWGEKHKRAIHVETGAVIEMFRATIDTWGYIYALRTGPGDFNKMWASKPWDGGCLPIEMALKDGIVYRNGQPVYTPTEEIFFAEIGIPYWSPEQRSAAQLGLYLSKR